MFNAMNRFKVIKEERKAFEDLWVTRQSHLDKVKGFWAGDLHPTAKAHRPMDRRGF